MATDESVADGVGAAAWKLTTAVDEIVVPPLDAV
jgi:hypothetical protein